jgi:hypothetical protein
MLNYNNNNKENFITIGKRVCPWMKENLVKTSGQVSSKLVFHKQSVQKAKRHNGGTVGLKQQSEIG